MAQQALDLNYDGLMTEVHPTPDEAWSDAERAHYPSVYAELASRVVVRRETTDNIEFLENIENLRHKIDEIDLDLLNLLARRMRVAEDIGRYKLAQQYFHPADDTLERNTGERLRSGARARPERDVY